jgi:hypothetical protein
VRTGRDEESLRVEPSILEWLIRVVPIVREAALQTAANVREVSEPAPVRGELITIRHPVPDPKPLQRQIREWRR